MQCSAATDPAALETSWFKDGECRTNDAEHKTQIWSPKATSSYFLSLSSLLSLSLSLSLLLSSLLLLFSFISGIKSLFAQGLVVMPFFQSCERIETWPLRAAAMAMDGASLWRSIWQRCSSSSRISVLPERAANERAGSVTVKFMELTRAASPSSKRWGRAWCTKAVLGDILVQLHCQVHHNQVTYKPKTRKTHATYFFRLQS